MTTWTLGCDFSYDKPDLPQLWAAGYRVILGYLSHTPGKGLTPGYVAQALHLGFAIAPLYETTADMALGGRAGGIKAATTATAIARELGCPADVPILYALDRDYSPAEMAGPVSDFVAGLHAVTGPDGEYGGYDQIAYLIKHRVAGSTDPGFQAYAWSNGRWLPSAQAPIEQYHNGVHVAGGTVDDCRIDTSRITLWEAEMALSADDGKTVWSTDVIPNTAGDAKTNPTTAAAYALGDVRTRLIQLGADVVAMKTAIAALPKTTLPAGPLSDADVARLAAATVDLMAKREAS